MDHAMRWEMAVMESNCFADCGQPGRTVPIPSDTVLAVEGELTGLRADAETRGVAVLVSIALAFGVGLFLGWMFAPIVG